VCGWGTPAACVWHRSAACRCVVRCDGCGHRFRCDPASAWLDASVYDAAYHAHRKTEGRPGFADKARTARLHLDLLGVARRAASGVRLLDVGCATGDFLVAARERGFDVCGVDVAASAVDAAAARGLAVQHGAIADVADGPFDVVHASHVLEHVPDVGEFVRAATALLRPGGVALIEVPNEFDEALAVLQRVRGRRAPARLDAPHVHYFTATSLLWLLEHAGLRVRRLLTYSHRRPADRALGARARLRYVEAPNAVLRMADRLGYGRNLVVLAQRGGA